MDMRASASESELKGMKGRRSTIRMACVYVRTRGLQINAPLLEILTGAERVIERRT